MKKYILIDLAYAVAITLLGIFGSLPVPRDPLILILLVGLASYRGGRAIAYNLVGKPLRNALGVEERLDPSGAGNSNYVTEGESNALGNLVDCPICSGTLVAAALLLVYGISASVGIAFIYVLAGAGIAEAIHWVTQAAEWQGHEKRWQVGQHVRTEIDRRQEERERLARQRAEAEYNKLKREIEFGFEVVDERD